MVELALRRLGWAAFAGVIVLVGVGLVVRGPDPLPIAGALAAVGAAPFIRRGSRLLAPAAVLVVAGVTAIASGVPSNVAWFALTVVAGWLAVIAPTRIWLSFWAGCVVLLAVQWATADDGGWAPWIIGTSFASFACFLSRRERELAESLRRAQAGLADRARAEERNRIAREVHDVVAHSLTVSLLHISGARLAVEAEPAEAAAALAEAERLTGAALAEVRQTVGMLRRDDDRAEATTPLPDARRIDSLVDGFRQAGATVDLVVDGDLARLPGTVGLAAYRILQEALTNGVRHARAPAAAVRIAATDAVLTLTVDTGPAAGPPGSDGTGLRGMRERAEAVGGSCAAGPHGTGWRVDAVLPLVTP